MSNLQHCKRNHPISTVSSPSISVHRDKGSMIPGIAAAVALLWIASATALAQSTEPYPAGVIDARTLRVQEKVEALFEAGDYERAMFIYKHELAPLGDKYAQYMIGYMYLTGAGVDEDPVTASAWYRLAAERANPEFMAVRDQLLDSLSDTQKRRSDEAFIDLRQRYSDIVILVRLIREDLQSLAARTGSRTLGTSGQVMIVDPRTGFGTSGEDLVRQLRQRIRARLEVVDRALGPGSVPGAVDKVDIDELERRVSEHVAALNSR